MSRPSSATVEIDTAHCGPHFGPDGTCWCPCLDCLPPATTPEGPCGCADCPCRTAGGDDA